MTATEAWPMLQKRWSAIRKEIEAQQPINEGDGTNAAVLG